ncbi:hypothetical protein [Paenibacillus hunanensis]|uniref:Uncharacterized protein n=1 Tax=Paenibacillus hunanensis TaxID=539262 RepID=A0ABU1ISJ1_9BACL|nr:hypothetical protein [Paenibacillus hunanensis]MDR6242208.1 hypothetical protein [Paenibacillus hunanensis]GGJ06131.1 hypothetical protein GCM10008022_13880 [Paenibacillus hunanensis]
MIEPTKRLIELFRSEVPLDSSIIQSYCDVIASSGDADDAKVLLEWYKKHAEDWQYVPILQVVMRCGDMELAAELYAYSFEQGRLRENAPDGILHILAYMGYPLPSEYIVDCVVSNDQDACLALLHMPYDHHYSRIVELFDQMYGQALFPELLPALCVQWAPEEQMVPKLLAWGKQASIDCNGGLVLGIAMYGPAQKDQIKQILWDTDWELYSNGTGGHWWAYMSMPLVELTFAELIQDLKHAFGLKDKVDRDDQERIVRNGGQAADASDPSKRSAEHCFDVLHSLLQLQLEHVPHPLRYVTPNRESMIDLYQQLFAWSTPHVDDSILGVIGNTLGIHHRLMERFYHLRSTMELVVRYEIERMI